MVGKGKDQIYAMQDIARSCILNALFNFNKGGVIRHSCPEGAEDSLLSAEP